MVDLELVEEPDLHALGHPINNCGTELSPQHKSLI